MKLLFLSFSLLVSFSIHGQFIEWKIESHYQSDLKRLFSIESNYPQLDTHRIVQTLGSFQADTTVSIHQSASYQYNNRTVWVVGDEEQKVLTPRFLLIGSAVMALIKTDDGLYQYAPVNELQPFRRPLSTDTGILKIKSVDLIKD